MGYLAWEKRRNMVPMNLKLVPEEISEIRFLVFLSKTSNEEGDFKMAVWIYHYVCTNFSCRNVEIRSGVRYSQITCSCCGNIMRLYKTEKRDSATE